MTENLMTAQKRALVERRFHTARQILPGILAGELAFVGDHQQNDWQQDQVNHNIDLALRYADEILARRDRAIEEIGGRVV